MERVVEVAGKKRQLPFDVKDETAAKPSKAKTIRVRRVFSQVSAVFEGKKGGLTF